MRHLERVLLALILGQLPKLLQYGLRGLAAIQQFARGAQSQTR